MANEILSSSVSTDQEKFLAAKLISRSYQKLVAATVVDEVQMKKGAGLTAYFIRYKRMNVPLVPLTEGVNPPYSSFTLEQVTVTLDQWGDVIALTDVAEMTTSHPLLQQATELLSDNAQRVIDREIQLVWLAGTNVMYGDGVVTARNTITNTMKATDALFHKAYVSLATNGAPPRGGPSGQQVGGQGSLNQGAAYVGIAGVEILRDIMAASTSMGTWASVAMYANQKALYNNEVGQWLGIRWVETNFIPRFKTLGNATAAVASGSAFGADTPVVTAVATGGTLPATTAHYFKITRKDKTRGFEEDVSIQHSMNSAAGVGVNSFTFNFSGLTAGYVYQVYFGSVVGDANLELAASNVEVGTTITVTAVPPSTVTPPTSLRAAADGSDPAAIHVVYIHGAESTSRVSLQNLQVMLSDNSSAIVGNPLKLIRTLGYKFMNKAVIRDQTRLLRLEVASAFTT